ncbi:hypothetical protein B566_EDAN011562 [Ephemera danica]|nr:hypothetical protein B566_EDAN011562 [Ephemera danica]
MADSAEEMSDSGDVSFLSWDLFPNIINFSLLVVIIIMLYMIYKSYRPTPYARPASSPELPKLRRDFTPEELRAYNGTGPEGRILVAVNGKVFDVTRGRQFYGPGAPYSAFGGRDASRGLATFSVEPAKDDYDDLSDLTSVEMDSMREWEEQFRECQDFKAHIL